MLELTLKQTIDHLYSGDNVDYLCNKEGGFMGKTDKGFCYGYAKEAIEYHKSQGLTDSIIERFNDLEIVDDHAVIYRGLAPIDKLDVENLGICWTMIKRKAYAYDSTPKDMRYLRLCALVNINDINWSHTLQKQMVLHNHEKEVVMNKGSEVTVLRVETLRFTTSEFICCDHRMFKARI